MSKTNFTVARVKRDILGRSYIGAIFTNRSVGLRGSGASQAYGVDAGFNLGTNLSINAFLAQTQVPDQHGDDMSSKLKVQYAGDRYGVLAEYLTVDRNFNPEVGFVRRSDMRRSFGQFRFSPRPKNRESRIRKYWYTGGAEIIRNSSGRDRKQNLHRRVPG